MNEIETFQQAVINALGQAAKDNVHPAIVYTILGGLQNDVLMAIKQTNRATQNATPPDPKLPEVNPAQ